MHNMFQLKKPGLYEHDLIHNFICTHLQWCFGQSKWRLPDCPWIGPTPHKFEFWILLSTPELEAFIASTLIIVTFGEILPQSICYQHGLKIGSALVPFAPRLPIALKYNFTQNQMIDDWNARKFSKGVSYLGWRKLLGFHENISHVWMLNMKAERKQIVQSRFPTTGAHTFLLHNGDASKNLTTSKSLEVTFFWYLLLPISKPLALILDRIFGEEIGQILDQKQRLGMAFCWKDKQ